MPSAISFVPKAPDHTRPILGAPLGPLEQFDGHGNVQVRLHQRGRHRSPLMICIVGIFVIQRPGNQLWGGKGRPQVLVGAVNLFLVVVHLVHLVFQGDVEDSFYQALATVCHLNQKGVGEALEEIAETREPEIRKRYTTRADKLPVWERKLYVIGLKH